MAKYQAKSVLALPYVCELALEGNWHNSDFHLGGSEYWRCHNDDPAGSLDAMHSVPRVAD